jgi:hypothetical protein
MGAHYQLSSCLTIARVENAGQEHFRVVAGQFPLFLCFLTGSDGDDSLLICGRGLGLFRPFDVRRWGALAAVAQARRRGSSSWAWNSGPLWQSGWPVGDLKAYGKRPKRDFQTAADT